MNANVFTRDDVRLVSLDGVLQLKVRCPKCRTWVYCDDDQFYGHVSLRCGNEDCDFHETHDLSELFPWGA